MNGILVIIKQQIMTGIGKRNKRRQTSGPLCTKHSERWKIRGFACQPCNTPDNHELCAAYKFELWTLRSVFYEKNVHSSDVKDCCPSLVWSKWLFEEVDSAPLRHLSQGSLVAQQPHYNKGAPNFLGWIPYKGTQNQKKQR